MKSQELDKLMQEILAEIVQEMKQEVEGKEQQTVKEYSFEEFVDNAVDTFTAIDMLFEKKNKQYSNQHDVLSAFKKGAKRRHGEVTKSTVLQTILDYKDKHDLALLENGAALADADDRLNDIIIYCLFAKLVLK